MENRKHGGKERTIRMRLFFAICLDEAAKDSLCAAMEAMRPGFERAGFTPRENLHLTLVFLGETPPARLPALRAAMDAVSAEPFPLCVGGVGCFRQPGGRLYWAGVERSGPLMALYDSLRAELERRGFRVDARPYRPHLTLARRAVLREDDTGSAIAVPVIRVDVKRFSLMRSDLGGGRPVYTELAGKELGKAAEP